MPSKEIYYSDKYNDETHEYRHVILPKVPIFMAKPPWPPSDLLFVPRIW